MLSIAERHKYILDTLKHKGYAKVNEMAEKLDVTPATIRNDFKTLEEQKLLYRTHGSASPVNPFRADMEVSEKGKINTAEKIRIGRAAAKLLDSGDSIILGAGSTIDIFARQIPDGADLTVVTTSPRISLQLHNHPSIDVIQLGGVLRKSSMTVTGEYTNLFLDSVNCSKLFLGVDGIDLEFGITNSNMEEALLNAKMIESSVRVIVLADSSKFSRRGFGKVCQLDKVDVIVTDDGVSPAIVKSLEDMGIDVIQA